METEEQDEEELVCDRCGNPICFDSDMIVYEDDLYDEDGSLICSDCQYADFCSTNN
jgi:hypothetical protein